MESRACSDAAFVKPVGNVRGRIKVLKTRQTPQETQGFSRGLSRPDMRNRLPFWSVENRPFGRFFMIKVIH